MPDGQTALLDEPARFRADALDRAQLAAAWELRATDPAVAAPIRAYAALDESRTLEQRVRDCFDEVESAAAGALPDVVLIGSPTGSGWVNSAALTAVEAWTRGNCASVALQYGALRSQASIRALPLAATSITAMVREAARRIEQRSSTGAAPAQLVIWAESLGAWALLLALVEDPKLLDLPFPVHVVWVGVPGPALADPQLRATLDARSERTTLVASGDELDGLQLDPQRSDVLLTHADDPVAHLPGPSLAWRRQRHTVPTAPTRLLYRTGWLPLFTALGARRTLDRVTRPPSPTQLRGVHDYRYAAANVLRAVLGLDRSDLHVVQRLVAQRAASVLDRAA